MPSIFSTEQVKRLRSGVASCETCETALAALRRMNYPNETLEQTIREHKESMKEALKMDDEMRDK